MQRSKFRRDAPQREDQHDGRGGDPRIHHQPPQEAPWHRLQVQGSQSCEGSIINIPFLTTRATATEKHKKITHTIYSLGCVCITSSVRMLIPIMLQHSLNKIFIHIIFKLTVIGHDAICSYSDEVLLQLTLIFVPFMNNLNNILFDLVLL